MADQKRFVFPEFLVTRSPSRRLPSGDRIDEWILGAAEPSFEATGSTTQLMEVTIKRQWKAPYPSLYTQRLEYLEYLEDRQIQEEVNCCRYQKPIVRR